MKVSARNYIREVFKNHGWEIHQDKVSESGEYRFIVKNKHGDSKLLTTIIANDSSMAFNTFINNIIDNYIKTQINEE